MPKSPDSSIKILYSLINPPKENDGKFFPSAVAQRAFAQATIIVPYNLIMRNLFFVYCLFAYFHADDLMYGVFDLQLTDFFDNLWFHFPVPYKKGDILYDPCRSQKCLESGPVVMTGITPLAYEEDGREYSDTSDMNVRGYFQKDDGTIYFETTWNYMDYEYCPQAELKGKRRILTALSNYIKDNIDIEMLLRAYHFVLLEEAGKDIMPKGWWTDECM